MRLAIPGFSKTIVCLMAMTKITLLTLVIPPLLLSASSAAAPNQELATAISEMQKANYFTFIMLVRMISPSDHRFRGNLTFLMPNDRTLSKTAMPQSHVTEFVLRHSIPSPMLFDYLQHIPSGSVIPSSNPDYMLNISNNGRKNFFLNNAKLISPNICTAGSVFRCHGIDSVLLPSQENPTVTPPPLPPLNNNITPPTSLPPPNAGSSVLTGVGLLTFTVLSMSIFFSL